MIGTRKKYGGNIPMKKLGFGLMRLPQLDPANAAAVDVDDAPLLRTHQLYGQVVGLIGIVALLLAARHQDSHTAQCCYRL